MVKRQFLFLFFLLLIINIVSAAPPVTQVPTGEYIQIAFPRYTYVKQNTDFELHVHVFNASKIQQPPATSCYAHLYDKLIGHTAQMKLTAHPNNVEYEVNILGGNFSELGNHAYIIFCNSSGQTGFAAGNFITTPTGLYFEQNNQNYTWTLMAFSLILLIVGNWFKEEHWILRNFFAFASLGAAILLMNLGVQWAASSPNMYSTSIVSLTLSIVVLSVFLLYTFVHAFIETVRMLKNKDGIRWNFEKDKE